MQQCRSQCGAWLRGCAEAALLRALAGQCSSERGVCSPAGDHARSSGGQRRPQQRAASLFGQLAANAACVEPSTSRQPYAVQRRGTASGKGVDGAGEQGSLGWSSREVLTVANSISMARMLSGPLIAHWIVQGDWSLALGGIVLAGEPPGCVGASACVAGREEVGTRVHALGRHAPASRCARPCATWWWWWWWWGAEWVGRA